VEFFQQISECEQEAARWFLSRGYVIVFPLPRGYLVERYLAERRVAAN
jgi:hypothetical protein